MSGLSNACYRVEANKETIEKFKTEGNGGLEPPVLLFRKFEQDLTDKRVE